MGSSICSKRPHETITEEQSGEMCTLFRKGLDMAWAEIRSTTQVAGQ